MTEWFRHTFMYTEESSTMMEEYGANKLMRRVHSYLTVNPFTNHSPELILFSLWHPLNKLSGDKSHDCYELKPPHDSRLRHSMCTHFPKFLTQCGAIQCPFDATFQWNINVGTPNTSMLLPTQVSPSLRRGARVDVTSHSCKTRSIHQLLKQSGTS